jgi:hypothetical protein
LRTASNAGIASASCICPSANAASWASKLEESLAAEQLRKHMRFSKPYISSTSFSIID